MTKKDIKRPWIKYYPSDWRADPRLRMCSLAARGLWADILGFMHEAEPYGHLLVDGKQPSVQDLAALVGRPVAEVRKAFTELAERGVYSADTGGTIFSRRMVRDRAKEEVDRKNGKAGGSPIFKGSLNPSDKGGVNPPDKAQKLEAREPEPEERAPSLRSGGARSKAACRLPEDWEPSVADLNFAQSLLSDDQVRGEIDKFRDHWRASNTDSAVKRDWSAAWRNWCRNAVKFNGGRHEISRGSGDKGSHGGSHAAKAVASARRATAAFGEVG